MSTERINGIPLSEYLVQQKLFGGSLTERGNLSNEDELARDCPATFHNSTNLWSAYAGEIYIHGQGKEVWKWRTDDLAKRDRQMDHLTTLMHSKRLRQSTVIAVMAWMLSEMLTTPPTHIP